MYVLTSSLVTAVVTPDPDDGYVAQIAELPGAISQGDSVEEALANVREAAELYLEDAGEDERSALEAHPGIAPVQVKVV